MLHVDRPCPEQIEQELFGIVFADIGGFLVTRCTELERIFDLAYLSKA